MLRRFHLFALPLVLCAIAALASDHPENWLQVTSQHFTILTDGSEKEARHIADQFERMRAIFHAGFPAMQIDPAVPIVVIAVKNSKDFRALEPESYLAKGQLELAGLFLRALDKNYVLLRMDAGGEHPYATVYHEYTHLLFSKAEWLPLWLNEGLAQFYENTDVYGKDTVLGQASTYDILFLRQHRLIPLTTLFTVDYKSPYYHEENKGSIFYAESWALTHYLQVTDYENHTHRIADYSLLVANHVDPVTAATRAFGDLTRLQAQLDSYVEGGNYKGFRLTRSPDLDKTALKSQPVTASQANAVRADFLAYNQREKDARALLEQVLKDDPNNTLAHETMGYLEFRAGNLEQAQNWYQQAVKLDSQSFLASFYFASIAMNRGQSGAEIDEQIEKSLQRAISLNPGYAPSYDRLAVFYGNRNRNLEQAHKLVLEALQLDPGNLFFRLNAANILLEMRREKDALAVLQAAAPLAKTPVEIGAVQSALEAVQRRQSMEEQARGFHQEVEASAQPSAAEKSDAPVLQKQEVALKGPLRSATGRIENVVCSPSAAMDLDLVAGAKTISLHAATYYKIDFTALNFAPESELKPCSDLEGALAKVEYIEGEAKTKIVIAIELQK